MLTLGLSNVVYYGILIPLLIVAIVAFVIVKKKQNQ